MSHLHSDLLTTARGRNDGNGLGPKETLTYEDTVDVPGDVPAIGQVLGRHACPQRVILQEQRAPHIPTWRPEMVSQLRSSYCHFVPHRFVVTSMRRGRNLTLVYTNQLVIKIVSVMTLFHFQSQAPSMTLRENVLYMRSRGLCLQLDTHPLFIHGLAFRAFAYR